MERKRALEILGLPRSAREVEIRTAHAALRAHVMGRGADSDEVREAREAELVELDSALGTLCAGARTGWRRPSWLEVWALTATLLLLIVGLFALLRDSRPTARVVVETEGSGLAGAEAPLEALPSRAETAPEEATIVSGAPASTRAELVAEANLPGAVLVVGAEGQVEARGPADSRSYWLEPGEYALEVSHPECPDAWREEIQAEAQGRIEISPLVCARTGWLVVRANAEAAALSIDGETVPGGTPGKHPLRVGEHRVEVSQPGFQPWKGIVEIESAQVLELWAELEAEVRPQPELADERGIPEGWHDRVTQWLLSRYDRDRSGLLDRSAEIERIPCDEWLGLEASLDRSGLALPLTRLYGFDETGEGWVENALGISYDMHHLAYLRMKECGLR